MSDQDILGNPRQLEASLRLTLWLMQQKRIQLRNVIGHNESLTSPYHKEFYAPWKCQTHGDWNRADMDVYRAKLRRLAKLYGVGIGPPAHRVSAYGLSQPNGQKPPPWKSPSHSPDPQ
jgi:hypothetical protein